MSWLRARLTAFQCKAQGEGAGVALPGRSVCAEAMFCHGAVCAQALAMQAENMLATRLQPDGAVDVCL